MHITTSDKPQLTNATSSEESRADHDLDRLWRFLRIKPEERIFVGSLERGGIVYGKSASARNATVANAERWKAEHHPSASGCYFIPNEHPAQPSGQYKRLGRGESVADASVTHRRMLLIDGDAYRIAPDGEQIKGEA